MSFKIKPKGNFHITFDNGVTVSVLIASGSYSDRHDAEITAGPFLNIMTSDNAEIAAWGKMGEWITKILRPDANDDVIGWQTSGQVLDFMNKASQYEGKK
jgi:hypothetical protein